MINLRALDPDADFPRLAMLMSDFYAEPITVSRLQEWQASASPEQIRQRQAAVTDEGMLVGYGDAGRDPWLPAGLYWIEIIVDSNWQGQGIGGALYTAAERFAREQNATWLRTEVRDNDPASLGFAERRGYSLNHHNFQSSLDLATFDATRFAGAVEAVEATGIRFTSLAELGNTLDNQQKLYALNRACALDNPGSDGTFSPFEQFAQQVFAASWFLPEGQILALDGDRFVGLAAVGYNQDDNSMYNAFTGVDRAYRGRGIALVLKLLAIRLAQRHNATFIRTHNVSSNAPMLAINRKLGYQPEPGYLRLVKMLS